MAFPLRNIPIKRKLMLVILLTSGFAILLMGTALITYELVTFRSALTNNIEVLAQIIGSNSTATLAFDDRENAKEILRALAAENQITAAAIYDRNDYSVRAAKHGADEIGHLTDSFNQMLARLGESNAALTASEERLRLALEAAEAANKEKDQFLAIVSHELRTPLTPALAAAAMLESDGTVSPQIRKDLSVIRRNIEVEARLIDDLLDITRIVRGKLELRRQVVDVRSLLEHAMQNYCLDAAAKKQIRVSMKITAAQSHIFVDSSRMTQVFWNLLQNACKFTSTGGSIDVSVYNEYRQPRSPNVSSRNGDNNRLGRLVVEVSDTGMGISPETLPKIFNAFEQGERSRGQGF